MQVSEEQIFHDASEIDDPIARAEFLDRACHGDSVLRDSVQKLLDYLDTADQFLETPAAGPRTETTADFSGTVIDRYRLEKCIGRGGFGDVYRAQQLEPLQRQVALKIIRLGVDTAQIAIRFEAERQAIAMMSHPNIAMVFDAGTTPAGRPYVVMELVDGLPIDRFCDQNKLNVAAS